MSESKIVVIEQKIKFLCVLINLMEWWDYLKNKLYRSRSDKTNQSEYPGDVRNMNNAQGTIENQPNQFGSQETALEMTDVKYSSQNKSNQAVIEIDNAQGTSGNETNKLEIPSVAHEIIDTKSLGQNKNDQTKPLEEVLDMIQGSTISEMNNHIPILNISLNLNNFDKKSSIDLEFERDIRNYLDQKRADENIENEKREKRKKEKKIDKILNILQNQHNLS